MNEVQMSAGDQFGSSAGQSWSSASASPKLAPIESVTQTRANWLRDTIGQPQTTQTSTSPAGSVHTPQAGLSPSHSASAASPSVSASFAEDSVDDAETIDEYSARPASRDYRHLISDFQRSNPDPGDAEDSCTGLPQQQQQQVPFSLDTDDEEASLDFSGKKSTMTVIQEIMPSHGKNDSDTATEMSLEPIPQIVAERITSEREPDAETEEETSIEESPLEAVNIHLMDDDDDDEYSEYFSKPNLYTSSDSSKPMDTPRVSPQRSQHSIHRLFNKENCASALSMAASTVSKLSFSATSDSPPLPPSSSQIQVFKVPAAMSANANQSEFDPAGPEAPAPPSAGDADSPASSSSSEAASASPAASGSHTHLPLQRFALNPNSEGYDD